MRLAPLVAALALAGCGAAEAQKECRDEGEDAAAASAPRIGVADAVKRNDEWARVTGAFVRTEGEMRLCASLAESFPPQCGQPSVRIEGVRDLAAFDRVERALGVEWVESVSVAGYLEEGTLRVLLSCRAKSLVDAFERETRIRLTLNTFGSNANVEMLDVASDPERVPEEVSERYGVFALVVSARRDALASVGVPRVRGLAWRTDGSRSVAARRYAEDVGVVWLAHAHGQVDDRWRRLDRAAAAAVAAAGARASK